MRLAMALKACPVVQARVCRSTTLDSWIVEMGHYCSCVSVALRSQLRNKSELNLMHDKSDLILNGCSSKKLNEL